MVGGGGVMRVHSDDVIGVLTVDSSLALWISAGA